VGDARCDSQRIATTVDSEVGETEGAGTDGSLTSSGRESEYVRGELVTRPVEGQSAVALEHDDHNVDFVVRVRVDARSRIEVYEIDVEVFALLEAPVDTVAGWIGARYLIERNH
jgi:hypothetical protein